MANKMETTIMGYIGVIYRGKTVWQDTLPSFGVRSTTEGNAGLTTEGGLE